MEELIFWSSILIIYTLYKYIEYRRLNKNYDWYKKMLIERKEHYKYPQPTMIYPKKKKNGR